MRPIPLTVSRRSPTGTHTLGPTGAQLTGGLLGTERVDSGFARTRSSGPSTERPTGARAQMAHHRAARYEWHEIRQEAAALHAESPQTRRRATEMRSEANALLDAVVGMVTNVLRGHGFAFHTPVEARFRCDENGSTGFEVEVRLEEPGDADVATAVLTEQFPDPLSSMIVR